MTQRDVGIYTMFQSGHSRQELVGAFGISYNRICAIIRRGERAMAADREWRRSPAAMFAILWARHAASTVFNEQKRTVKAETQRINEELDAYWNQTEGQPA